MALRTRTRVVIKHSPLFEKYLLKGFRPQQNFVNLGNLYSLSEKAGWSAAIGDEVSVVRLGTPHFQEETNFEGLQATLKSLQSFVDLWGASKYNQLPSKLRAIQLFRVGWPSELKKAHTSTSVHLRFRMYDELSWRTGHDRHPSWHTFVIELNGESLLSGIKSFNHTPYRALGWKVWSDYYEYWIQQALCNFQGSLRGGVLHRKSFPSSLERSFIPERETRMRIWRAEASQKDLKQRKLDFAEQERLHGSEIVESNQRYGSWRR